ncbi:MAG: hypothetical protein ACYTBP_12590 [Planctomycetota bacterium]|jgi:hypothetical protein
MTPENYDEKFDELLSNTLNREKPKFDFDKWKIAHKSKIEEYKTQTAHTAKPAAQKPSYIWRTIMKSRITKLTAAVVIVIAVLVGINHFSGSIDIASIAWADVETAFLAQSWVHLQYDNDEESWYNLKNGDHYHKQLYPWGNSFVYINRTDNLRQRYTPEHSQHITEDRPRIYKDNIIPPYEPKTAWESIVGHLEKMLENGGSTRRWEVEKYFELVDGIQLVRFDRYYNDAIGRRLLLEQIWADLETRLPVRIWKRLDLAGREAQNRESISGDFDFPKIGPSSIYDLGVPKALPIVKTYGRVVDLSIVEVVEAAKAHLNNFPQQYRSIRWDNNRASEIDIVWRNGEKIHHNLYFNLEDYPEYHLNLPASAGDVMEWSESQVPVYIEVWDGERSYTRNNPYPSRSFDEHSESQVRVGTWNSLSSPTRTHEEFWTYANRGDIEDVGFQLIDDIAEEFRDFIGLRLNMGDIQRDFYIDPQYDYICIRQIWWKQRADKWEKVEEYELLEFSQLPGGLWYPSKRILTKYPNSEKGTAGRIVEQNIDIELLENDDYPPDTFNGEVLLKGAKVETY